MSITPDMPRWWRIRANDLIHGGIGLRLPDYRPMGGKRTPLALTVLWHR